ncbi:hypothetical protein MuYL_2348 [Mucilaginibacter xinganensis]|uniref:Uncharacterized protein n=1 Tax=Mucilaginibacter xinganensis TaxID=1234841 RepID=A0A223NWJ4_9SPHI|nr:hypothetical protein MuYL_2348 [Mucilaginibacter xinganensis]
MTSKEDPVKQITNSREKPEAFHFCTRNTRNKVKHTDYQLLKYQSRIK